MGSDDAMGGGLPEGDQVAANLQARFRGCSFGVAKKALQAAEGNTNKAVRSLRLEYGERGPAAMQAELEKFTKAKKMPPSPAAAAAVAESKPPSDSPGPGKVLLGKDPIPSDAMTKAYARRWGDWCPIDKAGPSELAAAAQDARRESAWPAVRPPCSVGSVFLS